MNCINDKAVTYDFYYFKVKTDDMAEHSFCDNKKRIENDESEQNGNIDVEEIEGEPAAMIDTNEVDEYSARGCFEGVEIIVQEESHDGEAISDKNIDTNEEILEKSVEEVDQSQIQVFFLFIPT